MAQIEGYVRVYETSDGGSGNPAKTVWQFFVDKQPVVTENHWIAETMRLAVKTSSKVNVLYDPRSKTMSQARIEFKYICELREVESCDPNMPKPKEICETRRYAPCDPKVLPAPKS